MDWRKVRDGITIILGFAGIIAISAMFAATFGGCGGDGGEGDAAEILEANGIPSGPSVDCSGGDVTVTGGDGTITATGGDGGDCGNVAEHEEEDGGDFVDDGQPVPPFLGS